jgi:arsenical pump membrane protein
MSVLSAFALDGLRDVHHARAFAALIGGDLGPRILPLGSLAALQWFDRLRAHGLKVGGRQLVRVGVLLALPTLAVSLGVLWLLTQR